MNFMKNFQNHQRVLILQPIQSLFQFSKIQKLQSENIQKLIFDEQQKSQIFFHRNGEANLRWLLRGTTVFTLLNTFLGVAETVNPIFGGWNGFSFGICSFLGFGLLAIENIFSKRIVAEIKLLKQGDFVEIRYFNAFWTPQIQTVNVSEFADLEPSYFGFHKVDLTSTGKIWINLEKNSSLNPNLGYDVMLNILSGNPLKIDALKQKKKYLKN